MNAVGIVGKKIGMTRIFSAAGVSVPVSVVLIEDNKISQIKTTETDGYNAVQIAVGQKKRSRVRKPQIGHTAKANIEPGQFFKEFCVENVSEFELGGELSLSQFSEGQFIDVTGITKGKGFAGCVKRHHFRTQDATHGNSVSHRVPGSIGQNQTPGRVFKGKKMAGHMGNVKRTVQSLAIVRIDADKKLIMIKGAIPGANGGVVILQPAVKKH